jgi:hypothetical protein
MVVVEVRQNTVDRESQLSRRTRRTTRGGGEERRRGTRKLT